MPALLDDARAPRTIDLSGIDAAAFARDVDALHAELLAGLGPADAAHLHRMIRWGRTCSLLGLATAALAPNPLSVLLLSTGTLMRLIVMHHVGHRGYDRVPGLPARLTSRAFAVGWRRFVDWFDWMVPEAWILEHNGLHHPRTQEDADPDLVERNLAALRSAPWPKWVRAVVFVVSGLSWKFIYYAPTTMRELHRARRRRAGTPDAASAEESLRAFFDVAAPRGRAAWRDLYDPRTPAGWQLWTASLLPYTLVRFVALPALFLPFGTWAALSVLVNLVAAELVTNLHSFAVILPNHVGDDIPRFEGPARDKADFYVRQVAGSVNFTGGTDLPDFLQGYLNYQIEHHVWPDLPMLKYREAQPKLQAICARHGVPYVREPILRRLGQLWRMVVGRVDAPLGRTTPVAVSRDAAA